MSEVTVIKHALDGRPPVRYSANLLPSPDGWIVARATWVHGAVDAGPLSFRDGDTLEEFFSLDRPYNAFAIYRPGGEFAGWYCNVTQPTEVHDDEIHWHDLFVDVLVTPDGRVSVEDEHELEESGLRASDPETYAMVLTGRDELLALIRDNAYPFNTVS